MDQLTTGLAADPTAMGDIVDKAQEEDGNSEGENGGDVGIHEGFLN